MTKLTPLTPVAGPPRASCAVNVSVVVPTAVGVPEITPALVMLKPAGKAPPAVTVNGEVPEREKLKFSGVPTVPVIVWLFVGEIIVGEGTEDTINVRFVKLSPELKFAGATVKVPPDGAETFPLILPADPVVAKELMAGNRNVIDVADCEINADLGTSCSANVGERK